LSKNGGVQSRLPNFTKAAVPKINKMSFCIVVILSFVYFTNIRTE